MKKNVKSLKISKVLSSHAKSSTISRVCRCCYNFFRRNHRRFPWFCFPTTARCTRMWNGHTHTKGTLWNNNNNNNNNNVSLLLELGSSLICLGIAGMVAGGVMLIRFVLVGMLCLGFPLCSWASSVCSERRDVGCHFGFAVIWCCTLGGWQSWCGSSCWASAWWSSWFHFFWGCQGWWSSFAYGKNASSERSGHGSDYQG